MNAKIIVFDMDGVLAGLYNVPDWLKFLEEENPFPYIVAKPLVDMVELRNILLQLKNKGVKIVITSWLAKKASLNYNNQVRYCKKMWLDFYKFPYDEIHFLQYGTTKANATRHYKVPQTLIDDNQKIRKGWNLGESIDGSKDFKKYLKSLVNQL